jgi:type IV secretion system protein VirB10
MVTETEGGDQWTPPPRFNQYYSGRRKLAIAAAAIAGAVALYFVANHFINSHPALPTRTEEAKGHGLSFPAYQPPATQPLPKPKTVAQRFLPQLPTTQRETKDDILAASSDMANEDGGSGGGNLMPPSSPLASLGGQGEGSAGKDDALTAALQPSDLGRPTRARIDRHAMYEISAGRHIHCTRDVAVNSELPGIITCVLPNEVRNDSNTLMLLPKGSHAIGQIQHGVIQGNDRLFVLWTEFRTSDDPPIKIPIHSPAADELGRTGMTGAVNDFFWPNLLATAVYSFVDAGPQLVESAIQNNSHTNNQLNFNQLYAPEQSLAGRVLQQRLNRPPVLEANQGDDLMIIIGQDIDCSDAVHIRLRDTGEP